MQLEEYTHPAIINSTIYRRPYLNFREKITQLFLNPYSVVLFLLIIKLLFFLNSLINSLNDAQKQTHLLYNTVQTYGNNIVSFPHYMAKVSNIMISKAVNSTNQGLVKTLNLMMTASQNLIFFIIEISVGTYACLLTAAIDNTAIAALNATESLISIANETLISFATDLNVGLADLSDAINEVVDTAEDTADAIKHMFGGGSKTSSNTIDEKMSHVNLTIKNMENWEISPSINDKIESLKDKIPDFTDVTEFTKDIIDKPFNELKNQVNKYLNDTFEADAMYVPKLTKLDFSQGTEEINELFDHIRYVAKTSTHVIMGLISFTIFGFIIYELYVEYKDWNRVQTAAKHLNLANESYIKSASKNKYNIEVIKSIQNRRADFIGKIVTTKILNIENPVIINNIRWIVNYSASPFLFSFLLLGLLGIVSVIFQFIILALISKIDVATTGENLFIYTKTNIHQAFNTSVNSWSNETNNYLLDYQNHVNDNLFAWVDTAAMSINDTVTQFDKKMNSALDSIFKGTPLYKPIEQIVGCVIESKLKKIEQAMTWLSENAYLEMPELDPKIILGQMLKMKAENIDDSLNDNFDSFRNEAKELIYKIISFYRKECFFLLYISLAILGIWFVFLLIGLSMLYLREEKIKKNGGIESPITDFEKMEKSDPSSQDNNSISSKVCTLNEPYIDSFSTIVQSIREKYIKARTDYARTPTEPHGESLKENESLYDCEYDNTPSHFEDAIEEQPYNDATMSEIGENFTSLSNAKCWTP